MNTLTALRFPKRNELITLANRAACFINRTREDALEILSAEFFARYNRKEFGTSSISEAATTYLGMVEEGIKEKEAEEKRDSVVRTPIIFPPRRRVVEEF